MSVSSHPWRPAFATAPFAEGAHLSRLVHCVQAECCRMSAAAASAHDHTHADDSNVQGSCTQVVWKSLGTRQASGAWSTSKPE